MPTFITDDNWLLRRRGIPLFYWGDAINHQATFPGIVKSSAHSREYYEEAFPANWVLKIKDACGNYAGSLRLEVKRTEIAHENVIAMYLSDKCYFAFTTSGVVDQTQALYEAARWNGNDHQYTSYRTLSVSNLYFPPTPDDPDTAIDESFPAYYQVYINTSIYTYREDIQSTEEFLPFPQFSKYTPNPPWVKGNYDFYSCGYYLADEEVAEYIDTDYLAGQSILKPSDLITTYPDYTYSRTEDYFFHEPGEAHWNNSANVKKTNVPVGSSTSYDKIDTPTFANATAITFIWDDTWTAKGYIQKITTEIRWKYTNTSGGCKWWAGYTAKLTVKYKAAQVTKTNGPDGVFLTIGTFNDAGTEVSDIVLPDKTGTEWLTEKIDMPTAEGYIYVIDDIEISDVEKP